VFLLLRTKPSLSGLGAAGSAAASCGALVTSTQRCPSGQACPRSGPTCLAVSGWLHVWPSWSQEGTLCSQRGCAADHLPISPPTALAERVCHCSVALPLCFVTASKPTSSSAFLHRIPFSEADSDGGWNHPALGGHVSGTALWTKQRLPSCRLHLLGSWWACLRLDCDRLKTRQLSRTAK
jgi:hypothetical protein